MTNHAIEHIVLFSFSDYDAMEAAVEYITGMKDKALRDGKPYIISAKCGTTRPSGKVRSLGFNLASTITFATDDDRLYFVKNDPVHQGLVEFVKDKLAKEVLVLDFIDGLADPTVRTADC